MTLPKPPSLRCLRSFSTTLRTPKPTTQSHQVPRYTKGPPPYPYGPAQHYKQSDSGLYGGAKIQFGNLVSEKNSHKSRRAWRPNIHNKRLWSDGLGWFVQVKVQARVLRTIDKCGGLDEYLLGEKAGRIKELGVEGWRLRWLVMRTGKVRRRVKGQKEAMGLVGVGKPATSTQKGNSEGRKARVAATLEDEVKRASREVIEEIDNTPSSQPTPLIHHINLTTRAISAETAHRLSSQTKTSLTNDPDDNNNPTQAPGRRYTKGEKRAWRAEQASKRLSLDTANGAGVPADKASALMAEVARIEEVVEGEMEGMEGAGRERLEVAMEMLRGASEELERVMAGGGAEGMGKEKGTEGGVLGRIKGLFARR